MGYYWISFIVKLYQKSLSLVTKCHDQNVPKMFLIIQLSIQLSMYSDFM